MTKKDARKIRKLLIKQQTELIEEVAAIRKEDVETKIDCGAEVSERALFEADRALAHRHVHNDTILLRNINLALKRLEDGTYETCLRCRTSIPLERLFARPSTALCITCQQVKEQLVSRIALTPNADRW